MFYVINMLNYILILIVLQGKSEGVVIDGACSRNGVN